MKIALPLPRRRRDSPVDVPTTRQHPRRFRLLLLLTLLVVLAGGVWYRRANTGTSAPTTIPVPVVRGDLTISVESSGTVQPASALGLQFQTSGQVKEVLVKPGDQVRAGQPLARLDDRELRLEVQQAEANLQVAQADLDAARHGSATPEDLREAEANLRAAKAQFEKARTGDVTTADLREAEANLRAAKARLAALQNPAPDDLSSAQLALTDAQANLERTRDELSAAKTNAQLELERAVNALTQAQSNYATAYHNWQYVERTGNDPANPTTTGPDGTKVDNTLSDLQRQAYHEALVQAEAALHSAEAAVAQAQVAYDTARQQEAVGVQAAEARVRDAQQHLDALRNPAPTDLAQAQAEVARAQAQVDRLRQGGTAADVAAAQAQVDAARAALDKLTAPEAESAIAVAEAKVAQAQAQLDAARLALEGATLTAPFDGTVTEVEIVPGSSPGQEPVITIVDTSSMHLDVEVSENDVPRITTGQPVTISFDALEETVITGTVAYVATAATSGQDVVTYLVRVRFEPGAAPIKVGMSATANITVETHKDVIQVPNRALTSQGPQQIVQVYYGEELVPVRVETGATNGEMTEIVSCPDIGKQCLREGDRVAVAIPTSSSSQGGGAGEFFMAGPGPGAGKPIEIRIKP
jgi:HlyD family secretion protein